MSEKDTKRTVDHHCRECDAWDEAICDSRPLCDTCFDDRKLEDKWRSITNIRKEIGFAGETIECPHCGRKGSGMAIALHEPKCKKKRSRKL
jgi:hypothetical protein